MRGYVFLNIWNDEITNMRNSWVLVYSLHTFLILNIYRSQENCFRSEWVEDKLSLRQ